MVKYCQVIQCLADSGFLHLKMREHALLYLYAISSAEKTQNILTRVFLTRTIISLGRRGAFIGPEGTVGLFHFLLHHREQGDG